MQWWKVFLFRLNAIWIRKSPARVSNSISVTLNAEGDINAGEVIDTAVEAGANTVSGAYFFLSQERQQEVQEGLIGDAIANARHRADIAADSADMQVSGVKSINLNDVYFPPFYAMADELSSIQILPGQQEVSMVVNIVCYVSDGATGAEGNESSAMEIARAFILSKFPGLNIEIDNELDLHTDMVAHISENELHLDYSVVDTDGGVHNGHIEVVDGEVTIAALDGQSIL